MGSGNGQETGATTQTSGVKSQIGVVVVEVVVEEVVEVVEVVEVGWSGLV
jgi:hypothetical protein